MHLRLCGGSNSHGKFFAGAFSPIILNLSMISCLTFFYFVISARGDDLAYALCLAVLIGGLFQLLGPWIQLKTTCSWKWKIDFSSSESFEKNKKPFCCGIFWGCSCTGQCSRIKVFSLFLEQEGALSYLFLSARLIELPLGVFAISISTVFFPILSQIHSSGEILKYQKCFARGVRLTFAITFPAGRTCFFGKPNS